MENDFVLFDFYPCDRMNSFHPDKSEKKMIELQTEEEGNKENKES